ncbi:MAG: DMT family transporter, partial [Promethearchaeota archaeon]
MTLDLGISIGIIIGIIAYSMLYLGKGIQKYAIEGYKDDKIRVKSKNTGWWLFGTILTATNMFVHWVALIFAPINIIAPLEGVGLIVLILFSYYILKEIITIIQVFGIISIIGGTLMVTFFNSNTEIIVFSDFNSVSFTVVITVLLGIESIVAIISKFKSRKILGVSLALIAGTFMAIQTLTKRITAIPDVTLTLIFTFTTFLLSVLTLVFTQIAFSKANANLVVPLFTSTSIIFAILSGVVSLNETLVILQYSG